MTLAGEDFLMKSGVFTEKSADTLLGYAYMQPGVKRATLMIDIGDPPEKQPSITYKVQLSLWKKMRYQAMYYFYSRFGVLGKLAALVLIKLMGAPPPNFYERQIEDIARTYLPSNYQVFVNHV